MNSFIFLILLFLSQITFAQSSNSPFENGKLCDCPCNKTWLMPEEEMDQLKLELTTLEQTITSLKQDSLVNFKKKYTKKYMMVYTIWNEQDNQGKQVCVQQTAFTPAYLDRSNQAVVFASFGGKFIKSTYAVKHGENKASTTYYFEYYELEE
jgi:hypothetical protein